MKPAPQTETKHRRDTVSTARPCARSPKTDCLFQAGRLGEFHGGNGGGKRLPSIRGISDEYFNKEARGHFASEAAFFGVIVLTISVPLFQVASFLAHWVL